MQTDHYFPFSIELGKLFELQSNKPLQMALIHVLINTAFHFNSNAPFGETEPDFPFENTFRGAAQTLAEALEGDTYTENSYSILLGEFYSCWRNPYKVQIGYEKYVSEIIDKLHQHPWIDNFIYSAE